MIKNITLDINNKMQMVSESTYSLDKMIDNTATIHIYKQVIIKISLLLSHIDAEENTSRLNALTQLTNKKISEKG